MTVLEEEAQTPLDIVHTNVFVPVIKLVTPELLRVGVVTLEPPAITVHKPLPIIGLFPFNVNVEAHKFSGKPAFATVGTSSIIIATVDVEEAQGKFEISHWKIFVPTASPVMFVVGENGLVIVPLPETNVHKPVPTVGVFAVIAVVGEEIQSV